MWQGSRANFLIVYHGTTEEAAASIRVQGVKLLPARRPLDFGPGFYTTTRRDQAAQWARVVAAQPDARAAVLTFKLPRQSIAKLETLAFATHEPSESDFWAFVRHCRAFIAATHAYPNASRVHYDVVFGPVASQWIERPYNIHPGFDQVSFHTDAGVALLNASIEEHMLIVQS